MAKLVESLKPKIVVKHCEEVGMDAPTLARCLAVNLKTVQRWQEGAVEPNESAFRSLEKLEAIYQSALRLLKKAQRKMWFKTPNASLGGRSPMDLLIHGEFDAVHNVLGMLAWGIYS